MSDQSAASIAVVGFGRMGSRIGRALLSRGWHVVAHDTSEDALSAARAAGADATSDPAEALSGADAVICSLPGPIEVRSVMLESGILDTLAPGAVYVETSTLPTTLVVELAKASRALGIGFLDSPLSGQPPSATAYIGASESDWVSWEPLIASFTSRWFHLGEPGAGTSLKLASQYLTYVTFVAAIEALELATVHGVDRRTAAEAFRWGSANSRALELVIDRLLDGRFDSGAGTVDLIAKDLAAAASLVDDAQMQPPFLNDAAAPFQRARDEGYGSEPSHAVGKIIQQSRRTDCDEPYQPEEGNP